MPIKLKPKLILGSQSDRRKEIFRMLDIDFKVFSPEIDEKIFKKTLPLTKVPEYLAKKKARVISARVKGKLVLSYDTAILCRGELLSKPTDSGDALKMLRKLNGISHKVITGISLAKDGKILNSGTEITRVTFSRVPDKLLIKYSRTPEPRDKAGSYAIQGKAAQFIEKISGCYYNVVGVPIQKTIEFLRPYYY